MKRKVLVVLVLSLIISMLPTMTLAATTPDWINTERLDQGAVGITYEAKTNKRIRLVVTSSVDKEVYDLKHDGSTEYFALYNGNDTYKLAILEQVTGNKYKTIRSATIKPNIKDPNIVYTNSIQNVNWEDAEEMQAIMADLIDEKDTDLKKVRKILNYIITNIDYDYDLAKKVTSVYIPEIDDTLTSGKAICYGYTNLLAGMLRSEGIPTKLVMGTTTYLDGYHAWNEAYVDGEWIILDATVDYAYKKAKKSISMIKKAKDYSGQLVY